MRFHFGMSFRPQNLFKYILLGLLGLLAFFGISKVKASTLDYTSIQVNNSNNQVVMSCNANSSKSCPYGFPLGGYQELIGRTFLINFDNTTLTNNHDYTFAIEFDIIHDPSDTAFEAESFLIYQIGSSAALNDTTITWSYTTTYDWEYDYYITSYTYQGQFKATSTSPFYASLKMENNESFYGVAIGNISLTDDSINQEIINSNYQNTQNIINNQNSNTQSIINNNNSNTQSINDTINDNLKDCRDSYNLFNINGSYTQYSTELITSGFLSINNGVLSVPLSQYNSAFMYYEHFYNGGNYTLSFNQISSNRPRLLIKIYNGANLVTDYHFASGIQDFNSIYGGNWTDIYDSNLNFTIPSGYTFKLGFVYTDWSISNVILNSGFIIRPFEEYGQQVCSNKIDNVANSIDNTNQSIQELNNTISDDTIDTSSSDSFFGNFNNNTHGLTGIVSLPLTTIQNLNNASCTPLSLTIPFINSNNNLQLPCLTPIYQNNFGTFFTLYQTIIFGFVSYYVCINIFHLVKDFKDPNKDKIEVMDL